ncbi:MAG: hypothetical protein H8E27_07620 [Verrucomicrobia subdivision 3 bacterium]|nr:hypothetical protein [Limisphaerales bacterium]
MLFRCRLSTYRNAVIITHRLSLARADVFGRRGAGGGLEMARPAADIRVGEVVAESLIEFSFSLNHRPSRVTIVDGARLLRQEFVDERMVQILL